MAKLTDQQALEKLYSAGILERPKTSKTKKALGVAKGLGTGLLKSAGEFISGGSGLIESAMQPGARALGKLTGRTNPLINQTPVGTGLVQQGTFKPASKSEAVGKFIGDVGQFAIPATGAAKGVGLVSKARGLGSVAKLGLGAVSQGLVGAGVEAAKQGELNKNVAITGGISGALPLVGAAVSKVARPIKQAIYAGKQLIPTTPGQQAKDIARGLNIGEAVSQTGVSLTRKSLLNKLTKLSSKLGKKADKLVDDQVKAGANKVNFNKLADSLKSELTSNKNLTKELGATPIDVPKALQVVDDVLNDYKSIYGKKKLDLNEIQTLKKTMNRGLQKAFNQATNAPTKAKPLTEMALTKNLKDLLEKEVKGLAKVNKKLSPLLTAKGRLKAKGTYSGLLTDTIFGLGGLAQGPNIAEDPLGAIWSIGYAVALKRGLTSTAARTTAGAFVKQIEKSAQKPAILQAVRELGAAKGRTENSALQQ